MFGWVRNSRIIVVFGIEIAVVYSNANLLFQNSENNCYSVILLFYGDDEIVAILLNSPLLFSTNNPNNISTIQNNITFLLSSR
jgi:hypothetical protein